MNSSKRWLAIRRSSDFHSNHSPSRIQRPQRVILETYGFLFFLIYSRHDVANNLSLFQEMGNSVKPVSLVYDVTTQILFALILLEFNYLFELRSKSQAFANWTLLVLIALGIDISMWLYLMLTGDPSKSAVLSQSSTTTVFLALTTLIAFLSSATIIVFVRKLP